MKEVKAAREVLHEAQFRRAAQIIVYEEAILSNGEEGDWAMRHYETMKLSRQQLYDEIWSISTSGVAKKYRIPYPKLKKACEDANIPLPNNTYWSSLAVGKKMEKPPLPDSDIQEVSLPYTTDQPEPVKARAISEAINATLSEDVALPIVKKAPERVPAENQTNVYERDTLYQEVWAEPVTSIAKKYGVSDVAIHKVCKSMNIPVPPRGYWAKIKAGKTVERTPLPPTDGDTQKSGLKTYEDTPAVAVSQEILTFLSDEDRRRVLVASGQICVADDRQKLHPKLIAHKAKLKAWGANHPIDPLASRKRDTYRRAPEGEPFLWGELADDTFPRLYQMLDALFQYIEALGGSVNDDLSLQIRGERVTYYVTEAEDKVPHALTKAEQKQWDNYEKEKARRSWAYEPKFRKWDYPFNGKLRFEVKGSQFFRDSNTVGLESRLSEILIALYERSETVRIERKAREEAKRKAEEEARQKELRRERYNTEVALTLALENEAADYALACRIRSYVTAVESKADLDDQALQWIKWAKAKADWYDPTISHSDPYFGKRRHSEDGERKKPQKSGRYSW